MTKYMGFYMQGEFKRYLFEYRHDNSEWALEVIATSPEDAKQRLKALTWARYQGEISAKVPIPGGGIIRKLLRAAGLGN